MSANGDVERMWAIKPHRSLSCFFDQTVILHSARARLARAVPALTTPSIDAPMRLGGTANGRRSIESRDVAPSR